MGNFFKWIVGADSLYGKNSSDNPQSAQSAAAFSPSPYHDSASSDLNNFYTSRVNGQNLGFSEEDLSTMRAGAIDSSNYATNEAIRRDAAGRHMTGGMTTGGMNASRDEAIRGGLQMRSQALRDIAVQNAVLKHTDQWNAAGGLQNFLNEQDQYALSTYGVNAGITNAQNYSNTMLNLYNRQSDQQSATDWTKLAAEIGVAAIK